MFLRSLSLVLLVCAGACSSGTTNIAEAPEAAGGTTEDGGALSPSDDGGSTPKPPAETSSKGTGGFPCTKNETVDGRAICVAKAGSVELKITLPTKGSGAYRLALYLHGDGAGAHKSNSALKVMGPWLDEAHALGVSALAPNGCAWWQKPSYDCSGSANAPDTTAENSAALVAALEALYDAFDVRLDGVAYYGSSGGSIFLTEEWLPLHGAKYFGVFALMCGGRPPRQPFAWDTNDGALVTRSPLFFTYGDQDFLVPDIGQSIGAFEAKTFKVTKKIIPGAQHCAFDSHGEAVLVWRAAF